MTKTDSALCMATAKLNQVAKHVDSGMWLTDEEAQSLAVLMKAITKLRDDHIRYAVLKCGTPQAVVAATFGLTPARISQICRAPLVEVNRLERKYGHNLDARPSRSGGSA